MTRRKPLTLNAGKLEQLPDNGAIAGVTPVRQTVLNGSVDSSGFPNALSIGSGLAVTLTATGTAFLLSFAAGFDSNGSVDYLGSFTANQTLAGLPANASIVVLYVDRDPATGALTLGNTGSNIGFTYEATAPTSPVTGQHWFDLSTYLMKQWSGSAWVTKQRVLIGECTTGASSVTSVTTYAYRGVYRSNWLAVTSNTLYAFNHNLGVQAGSGVFFSLFTSVAGSDGDAVPGNLAFLSGASYYGYQFYNGGLSTWKAIQIRALEYPVLNASNAWLTSGYYKLLGWRNF